MENWLERQAVAFAAHWGKAIEEHYPDSHPVWSVPEEHVRLVERAFRPALDYLDWQAIVDRPAMRGLDLGGGTGWLSTFLSTFDRIESIDCVDSDQNNLAEMLPSIVRLLGGDASKIRAILGLFEPLQVRNQTYDLVVASSSIHHAPNLFSVMREVARVLKPEGTFLILNELPRTFDSYLNYVMIILYHLLRGTMAQDVSEFDASISASGILYDRRLGDFAYSYYHYDRAIRAADLRYRIVKTPIEIVEGLVLVHFVCRKTDAAALALGTPVPSSDMGDAEPLTGRRVEQITKVAGEGIDYIEQVGFHEAQYKKVVDFYEAQYKKLVELHKEEIRKLRNAMDTARSDSVLLSARQARHPDQVAIPFRRVLSKLRAAAVSHLPRRWPSLRRRH